MPSFAVKMLMPQIILTKRQILNLADVHIPCTSILLDTYFGAYNHSNESLKGRFRLKDEFQGDFKVYILLEFLKKTWIGKYQVKWKWHVYICQIRNLLFCYYYLQHKHLHYKRRCI